MPTKALRMIFPGVLGAAAMAPMMPHSDFMCAMVNGMLRMENEMSEAPMNGDPDHDFAVMMIPHHRGAIEMAKVELRYGKSAIMRRMAQEILVDQQSEIEAMQVWLNKTSIK